MVTAKIIKDFFKNKYGLKKVRVESGTHYVRAWIQSNKSASYNDPLTFPEMFPVEFRTKCLNMIYPGMEGNERGCAGNIRHHDISMHRHEWEKMMSE